MGQAPLLSKDPRESLKCPCPAPVLQGWPCRDEYRREWITGFPGGSQQLTEKGTEEFPLLQIPVRKLPYKPAAGDTYTHQSHPCDEDSSTPHPQELKKPCTARDSQECLLEETVKKVAGVLGPHQARSSWASCLTTGRRERSQSPCAVHATPCQKHASDQLLRRAHAWDSGRGPENPVCWTVQARTLQRAESSEPTAQ